METLNNKITGGTLTASEWNQVPSELQNVITQTGQSLTNTDLNQLGKGIAQYAANGDFYTDSGAINAYVLTQIGTKQASTSYDNGMVIRFLPGNTNTTASTVNVATLGVKTIVNFNGTALVGGEIVSGDPVKAFFDLSNDRFQLLLEIGTNNYSLLKSGRKNAFFNGDYDIWQRGTSNSTATFLADRWTINIIGSTNTQSQQTFTVGQTDVPNNPEFFRQDVFVTGGGVNDLTRVAYTIEDVTTLADEVVTLSFYARSPTSLNLSTEFVQFFGTSGGSATINVTPTKHTLTTIFQLFTVTFTMPSVAGKSIGTVGDDGVLFFFWLDSGSNNDSRTDSLGNQSGTIEIAQVQLEKGTSFTEFENLSKGEVLQLCQRYFEKSYDLLTDPGTALATNGRLREATVRNDPSTTTGTRFNTTKRIVPTITIFSDTSGASGFVSNSGDKAAVVSTPGENGFSSVTVTGGVTGTSATYHFTADAEL